MRLDGLGTPVILQAKDKKMSQIKPVAKSPGDGDSSAPDSGAKLGQIFDLLEKAKRNKKQGFRKNGPEIMREVIREAIKKYQRIMSEEGEQQSGQTIDRII